MNTSGISYFCFLFLFSFYSFKFEKLDQTKLYSHTEVFYCIGCQPITYKSNVACHINSVRHLLPDAFIFRNVSNIRKKKKSCGLHKLFIFLFLKSPPLPSQGSGIRLLYNQTPIFRWDDKRQELWYDLQVSRRIFKA